MENNQVFGLVGKKLGHSFSKEIHREIFKLSNIDDVRHFEYNLFELNEDKKELTRFLNDKMFSGLNITIPYKQRAIGLCDEIDESVKNIGALNVICNRDGRLFGYNTDFYGFLYLLAKNNIEIANKSVAILGTGGTSKTVFTVLKFLKAKKIIFVSRHNDESTINYREFQFLNDIEVIVNTTPVGMFPNLDQKPVDLTSFKKLTAVVDVIYNPLNTALIRHAKAEFKNIKTANGLIMLVAQAKYAQEYFFNRKIESSIIDDAYFNLLFKLTNIALIGMPGCGKTTIGKVIAEKTNKTFIDTDELIEKKIEMSISKFFKKHGEEKFRQIESEIISEVSKGTNQVISTGGGVIKNIDNIENLKYNSLIFFIDRGLRELEHNKKRPLSSKLSDLENLYLERVPIYRKCCHKTVENSSTTEKCADDVIFEFEEKIKEI